MVSDETPASPPSPFDVESSGDDDSSSSSASSGVDGGLQVDSLTIYDGDDGSDDDDGDTDDILDGVYQDLKNAVEILECKWNDEGVEFAFEQRKWTLFILNVADMLFDAVPTTHDTDVDDKWMSTRRQILERMLDQLAN